MECKSDIMPNSGFHPCESVSIGGYIFSGNRLTMNDGTAVTTYTYSSANKIATAVTAGVTTTYSNDAAGNTTKATTSGVSIFYDYDAAGRMSVVDEATPVTLTYNADHQLILKQTNTDSVGYLFDHKHLVHETDGLGGSVDKTYTSGTDEEYGNLISEYQGTSNLYHMYDAQANTALLADSTGATLTYTSHHIQAFGQRPDGMDDAALRGWGRQVAYHYDLEIDLYLMGMSGGGGLGVGGAGRHYDADLGRFMSPDPLRADGGNINIFILTGNNPITNKDPSGRDSDQSIKTKLVVKTYTDDDWEKTGKNIVEGQEIGGDLPNEQFIVVKKIEPISQSQADFENIYVSWKIWVGDSIAHLWGGKYGSFVYKTPGQLILMRSTGNYTTDALIEAEIAKGTFADALQGIIEQYKYYELEQFLIPAVLETVGGVWKLKVNIDELKTQTGGPAGIATPKQGASGAAPATNAAQSPAADQWGLNDTAQVGQDFSAARNYNEPLVQRGITERQAGNQLLKEVIPGLEGAPAAQKAAIIEKWAEAYKKAGIPFTFDKIENASGGWYLYVGKPGAVGYKAPLLAINPVTGDVFFADTGALTAGRSGTTYFNGGDASVRLLAGK